LIDFWAGLINNGKNLGDHISIIKMLNDEIKKKLKDKEIAIKRIRISFAKKKKTKNKIERMNKNLELKNKIEKKFKLTNESKTKGQKTNNTNFQRT
jgi:hypothetical protein